VRFVCGALLGAIVGAAGAGEILNGSPRGLAIGIAIGALAVGALARQFGDRFWRSLGWWLWY
jgi:hypothetical protein